jgi:hypothetical protein
VDVLQDDGYILKNAVVELGIVTATKERDIRGGPGFGGGLSIFGGTLGGGGFGVQRQAPNYPTAEVLEASVNLTQRGREVKVRINVQRRILNNFGAVIRSEVLEDLKFYQEFFAKVDKGLYLQREEL